MPIPLLVGAVASVASKLLGGGGSSAPSNATSGDASSGVDGGLNYNGTFVLGGSGKQDVSSNQDATSGSAGSSLGPGIDPKVLFYAGGGLAVLTFAYLLLKRK